MNRSTTDKPGRRAFLKGAGAACTLCLVPGRVLAQQPNSKLTHAIIGVGGMGQGHIGYVENGRSQLVAVADVDAGHLAAGLDRAKRAGYTECRAYADFRDMLATEQIDICHVATPPHWHALASIMAADAGCDVWCEKPMTHHIGEGAKVIEAMARNNRLFRLNTWFRFKDNFYNFGSSVKPVKQLVAAGLLGWPLTVRVSPHTGFPFGANHWNGRTDLQPEPVPDGFDYDLWLGPAPYKPYNAARCHMTFRGYWDYDGGGLGDMGQHFLDPVQYFLDKDGESPVTVEAHAPAPAHPDACQNWHHATLTYADGCRIVCETAAVPEAQSITIGQPYVEGPLGRIWPGFRLDPPELRDALLQLPEPPPQVTDFVEAVRNRQTFALNEVNGHRSVTLVHLINASLRTGRALSFDSATMRFVGDEAANRLVDQPYRAPWHL